MRFLSSPVALGGLCLTPRAGARVLAGCLAGCLVAAAGCDRVRAAAGAAPPLHGAVLADPSPAPPLRLPVARGGRADTFDLRRDGAGAGRAVLLFFGYTHCPDICPTTLADWARARRALVARSAEDSARVRFVFVTVDPERDSAAVVARYVGQFDSTFVGLGGTRAAVDAVQRAWGIASMREPAAAGDSLHYTVSHPAQTFLVGPDGRLRTLYPLNVAPAVVAADLHQVLRGG